MASIEKRISKKGEVSYRIKVSLGYDSNGKQIIERSDTIKFDSGMTSRKIDKELKRLSVLFEEQVKQNQDDNTNKVASNHITFKELADEWLDLVTTTKDQKISSIERLKSCKERTYNAIGKTEVKKITYRQIQKFILDLSKQGVNQRTGQGLSTKTQKHYICFISDVMKYAIKCGIIISNPCKNISVVKTEQKEKDIYSLEELKSILAKINEKAPTDYKTFFAITSYLGLRRGEVLGLEYKDFDFDNSTVSIVRTSNYRNKATGIYTSTPKTKSSCRVLAVPDIVLDLVKQLKNEQADQSIKCGDLWHDTDRLFITWCGEPMHPNTPYTWLERFCDENKLPFKGLHSFRHTFATQAITSGTDVVTVSSILGHSQTSTTLNLYTHAVQAANVKAINVMADLISDKTVCENNTQ